MLGSVFLHIGEPLAPLSFARLVGVRVDVRRGRISEANGSRGGGGNSMLV